MKLGRREDCRDSLESGRSIIKARGRNIEELRCDATRIASASSSALPLFASGSIRAASLYNYTEEGVMAKQVKIPSSLISTMSSIPLSGITF